MKYQCQWYIRYNKLWISKAETVYSEASNVDS